MPDSPKPDPIITASKRRGSITARESLWNPQNITAMKSWLENLLHAPMPAVGDLASGAPFEDGQLLFRIARALAPDFRPNVKMVESQLPFLAGNNVGFFLAFLNELKIPEVVFALADVVVHI
jgi:hypothetical protein